MKQNKSRKISPEAEESGMGQSEAKIGCERRLTALPQDGVTRSLGTAYKDPTVHPETPRNNPNPG